MLRPIRFIPALLLFLTFTGCAWLDKSEHKIITGDYEVGWNDLEANRSITKPIKNCEGCYDVIVDNYVYAVGHTDKFIFAKQHPRANTTVTQYFLIDLVENQANTKQGIYGPLTLEAFEKHMIHFGLYEIQFERGDTVETMKVSALLPFYLSYPEWETIRCIISTSERAYWDKAMIALLEKSGSLRINYKDQTVRLNPTMPVNRKEGDWSATFKNDSLEIKISGLLENKRIMRSLTGFGDLELTDSGEKTKQEIFMVYKDY